MRLKSLLLSAALVIACGTARAQYVITLTPTNASILPGQSVDFSATVTNNTGGAINPSVDLVNESVNTLFPPGLNVTADYFFANQPNTTVNNGDSWSFLWFTVTADPSAPGGTFTGHAEIDDAASNAISTGGDFSVTVVPEGSSVALLAGGALPFLAFVGIRRRRRE